MVFYRAIRGDLTGSGKGYVQNNPTVPGSCSSTLRGSWDSVSKVASTFLNWSSKKVPLYLQLPFFITRVKKVP